jgi:hypothetical protein
LLEGWEIDYDQAPGKSCGAWIVAVDRGMWAGQQQSPLVDEHLKASQMRRPCFSAQCQAVFDIFADNGVPHCQGSTSPEAEPFFWAVNVIQMLWMITNTNVMPSIPNSLKLTQNASL